VGLNRELYEGLVNIERMRLGRLGCGYDDDGKVERVIDVILVEV
jgi:hypothetical protein